MKMIIKSISERSKLQAIYWNAKKLEQYIKKYCPEELKSHYYKELQQMGEDYVGLRKSFDKYTDKKTLKADSFFGVAI
jgi:hypothetical protein